MKLELERLPLLKEAAGWKALCNFCEGSKMISLFRPSGEVPEGEKRKNSEVLTRRAEFRKHYRIIPLASVWTMGGGSAGRWGEATWEAFLIHGTGTVRL